MGQLIMNTCSMGNLLQAEGFKGLPSSTDPVAGQTNYQYFRVTPSKLEMLAILKFYNFQGGYCVLNYHSETIDAIQVL